MKQIVACIRKDLQLNYHGILLYGICTVGLPFLFSGRFTSLETAMSVSVLFSVMAFLAGILHLEDGEETRLFLKSLPIAKKKQLASRFILTIGLILLSATVGGVFLEFSAFPMAAALGIACYAFVLFVYNIYGFNASQGAFILFLIGVVL